MMKVVLIGGEPATGKSTLVKQVISGLPNDSVQFKHGTVCGYRWPTAKVTLLGIYNEGDQFPGTDRLSMSVQQQVFNYISASADTDSKNDVLLIEGDRLFNMKFIDGCKAQCKVVVFVLTTPEDVLSRRHVIRGDSQGGPFLKGRKTKVDNIVKTLGDEVRVRQNRDHGDLANLILEVSRELSA